ncbi:MAG: lamin tail domain-containing protein [Patescibacteria group bacterium]
MNDPVRPVSDSAADSRDGIAGVPLLIAAVAVIVFVGGGFLLGRVVSLGRSEFAGSFIDAVRETFSRREPVLEITFDDRERSGAPSGTTPAPPCTPTSSVLIRDRVVLSEVAWMGTEGSAQNEWIELANTGDAPADVSGWRLRDRDLQIDIVIPNGAKIAPRGFYFLERKEAATPQSADLLYEGSLRNSDESLRLYDAECTLVDEAAAAPTWPAGDNALKRTMERDLATFAWHTAAARGGTPGTPNSRPTAVPMPPAVAATPAVVSTGTSPFEPPVASEVEPPLCAQDNLPAPSYAVLLNEVAWAGTGSLTTADEWVELRNPAPVTSVPLERWQLLNKARTLRFVFGAGAAIAPGGYLLLERTDDTAVPTVPADAFFTGAVKNNDESLRLFDASCRLVDEVVAGTSWPAGTAAPDYRSAERSADLSWHTYGYIPGGAIYGTPRTP